MIVQLSNIHKSFHRQPVLSDISLNIAENSFTAIHGKSGAGKSTILNIIGLLIPYDQGELMLFNQKAPHPNSKAATLLRRHQLAYLFQNYALMENATIYENLEIACHYHKTTLPKKEAMAQALERVQLSFPLSQKVYTLSGGEKQRLAIARLLLKDAPLILADEPTGSLDHENKLIVLSLLQELVESGRTVITVTHDDDIIRHATHRFQLNS